MAKKPVDEQRSLFKPEKKAAAKEPMLYVVPASTRQSTCRGVHCRKPIYWVYLVSSGRSVIVDCSPAYPATHNKHGTEHPSAPKCFPPVHPRAPGEHFGHGVDGQGIDHHATCQDVAVFGRKTTRKNDGSGNGGSDG